MGRNAHHQDLEYQAKVRADRQIRETVKPTTIRPKQPATSAANPYRNGSAN